jgi:hypothetical protein
MARPIYFSVLSRRLPIALADVAPTLRPVSSLPL